MKKVITKNERYVLQNCQKMREQFYRIAKKIQFTELTNNEAKNLGYIFRYFKKYLLKTKIKLSRYKGLFFDNIQCSVTSKVAQIRVCLFFNTKGKRQISAGLYTRRT